MQAQDHFATIKKNYNVLAANLNHDLNKTRDTLVLKSEDPILKVYTVGEYSGLVEEEVNGHELEVPLWSFKKGKYVFVVDQPKLKIVFQVLVHRNGRSIITEEDVIVDNSADPEINFNALEDSKNMDAVVERTKRPRRDKKKRKRRGKRSKEGAEEEIFDHILTKNEEMDSHAEVDISEKTEEVKKNKIEPAKAEIIVKKTAAIAKPEKRIASNTYASPIRKNQPRMKTKPGGLGGMLNARSSKEMEKGRVLRDDAVLIGKTDAEKETFYKKYNLTDLERERMQSREEARKELKDTHTKKNPSKTPQKF